MNNLTIEPMVKYSSQVHTTKDYFLFKSIDGNRTKNLLHINRLKKSMSENYLFTVIIVNERYEIIDGQHRFDVIQELKLPLHYIVCKGYGLNEVHILNQNSKTWNADDYLTGYCNLGSTDYLKYREFKDTYQIGHNECMIILSGTHNKGQIDMFYNGNFKIKNYNEACKMIEKILLIEPYYDGVRRRSFIYAMLQLFKNENFEFTEFLQKLKTQPSALVDCTNTSQYVSLIEEIYNYRRRDKVNLRY
jgi:hypothetical protein